jgi:biotin carboxylase
VSLIIIDEDRHWLQADTPENKQLREAFLTIDMTEDANLPDRIAAAIKSYPAKVDGIFTLSDNYLVNVARAAELLGLPSSPSSAYEIAYDKGLTRQLHAAPYEHTSVKDEENLHTQLAHGSFRPQYPLIVKPRTRGWNSQFVRKVHDQEELLLAVREICPRYNDGVVIEPYYDGPEVDVNMVMVDGQAAFQEIVDEPPSCGDLSFEISADFLENGMRAPSILPQQEQQSIFDFISKSLLELGFANGVFHVEARISQSSMDFRNENGSFDLAPTSPIASEKVQCHLIEINARPPGLRAQILTQLTYGVDYFAVQILSAVNDKERAKASCQPFNLPHFPQGAQSWSQLIHLPVLSKGTTAGVAGIERLLHQLPDVAPYVFEYQCCFEPGDVLPDPAVHADFFGHCIVSSPRGRWHVVKIADQILKAYRMNGVESTMAFTLRSQESIVHDFTPEHQSVLA